MNVALSDAMVATWDAKYAYERPRTSELDPSITTVLATPASPSYPSEHAAAAAAASLVLAYLFPDDAQMFADKADEASHSRLLAGVQYPSDIMAGQDLGRGVAALVIERVQHDGSDAQWTGTVPTQPGHWNGTIRFCPWPAPGRRGHSLPEADPPRGARAYAVESIAAYDSGVACFDAKYAYWAIRPFQLDPTLKRAFPTPNQPSYPAAHGCFSRAAAGALSYLFPRDAETLNRLADEAAQSRIWAGINFPTDVRVGLALGRSVTKKGIDQVQSDDMP